MRTDNARLASLPPEPDATPRLALRPREAAEALGIGVRKLWELTNCGAIRCVRIGRAVRYRVDELRDFLERQAARGR
ncbi:Helix-turn-helix domain protein [Phycisphaerae bacterium RAS1]|nr:Helix-turn-helix domain protein [Phycisphaerae bacterium RAS1]